MSDTTRRTAVALGSNSPDRHVMLSGGGAAVAGIDGVRVLAASRIEDTAPIGPPQPRFLNQMVLLETSLSLEVLLSALQAIELQHGRVRTTAKGLRTLDLDIVWAEGLTVTSTELLVPHPGLTDRDFWQRELAELLGVDAAAHAIAAAQVHAGMDTARRTA
jgi:2-amino-4-hydroxy-6-hydroxymethyldihydropteridine diphosphokinase